MASPEEWLSSTAKQRRDLFRTVSRLAKLTKIKRYDFHCRALGRLVSDAFDENFRKGKISARDAAAIYRFLQENHPEVIPALDTDAFTNKRFNDFLLQFRQLGLVQILPELISQQIASRRLGPGWAEFPYEAEDPICFRLRLPHAYEAVMGLNGSVAGWFPMRLQRPYDYELADEAPPPDWLQPHDYIKPATQGFQTVCTFPPTPAEGERRRRGNIFLFFAGSAKLLFEIGAMWDYRTPLTDDELVQLADRLTGEWKWSLAQINATGIGPYR